MNHQEEDKFHKKVFDFISDSNYNVSHIIVNCDSNNSTIVNYLISNGHEVFESLVGTENGNKCKILFRKKKR